MDKKTLTFEDVADLDFTTIIWIAAPLMFLLVALESYFSYRQKKKLYGGKDFMASLSIGLGNIILNGFMKFGVFAVFLFFYNISPFRIPQT